MFSQRGGIFKKKDKKDKKGGPKISKSEVKKFQKESFENHNGYRKKHKVSLVCFIVGHETNDLCVISIQQTMDMIEERTKDTNLRMTLLIHDGRL